MDLKEIKKIARLFDMMGDYEDISEIASYMLDECGFTKTEIIKLTRDIQNRVNLLLFELIWKTVYK